MTNQSTHEVDNYFRLAGAAGYLKVSKPMVRKLVRSGALQRAKLGRTVVFRRQDLDELVAARLARAA
jgi:excisionase family DNA binding protein